MVHAVHVVKALGQADDDYRQLATPTFVLRRAHLKRRYEKELKQLKASLRPSMEVSAELSTRHTH